LVPSTTANTSHEWNTDKTQPGLRPEPIAEYDQNPNKPFDDEDESDRKMWTEKYEFGTRVRDISVPIFLSFPPPSFECRRSFVVCGNLSGLEILAAREESGG